MSRYISEILKDGAIKNILSGNIKTRGFDKLNPDSMGTVTYTEATQTFSIAVKIRK